MPLIDALRSFTSHLRKNPEVLKRIITVIGLVVGAIVLWKVAMLAASVVMMAWNAIKLIGIGLWKSLNWLISDNTKETEKSTKAMLGGVAGAASFAIKVTALGGAFLLAAKGVAEIAVGFSELARAAAGLEIEQMSFLKDVLLGLGVTLVATTLTFTLFAKIASNPNAAIGIIALGAALVGIGHGINIASRGIAELVSQFTKLLKVAGPEQLALYKVGFEGLASPLGKLMTTGFGAAGAMATLALSFGLLGISLKFLGEDMD